MSELILVRHGHAAAGWGEDADPGLDDLGRTQARAMADALAPLGPRPVVSSPLRRCVETAEALGREPRIDPRVAEIPTPAGMGLPERSKWLRNLMAGDWTPDFDAWRGDIVTALLELAEDTIVVSHFVAINVAVGRATGDERAVCFMPDNCSRTVVSNDGGRLALVSLGAEARTEVR